MTRRSAIDCGSNSTRLLIVDHDGLQLERRLIVTRLAEGVDATGRLNPAALQRSAAALSEFASLVRAHNATTPRVVATSAVRDAENALDFADIVEQTTGSELEILSGEEEGLATFRGATAGLPDGNYVVIDIGGGSTELVFGNANSVTALSAQTGCVRLTEQFLNSNPYKPSELESASEAVNRHLADLVAGVKPSAGAFKAIGVAGTITSVASIVQGLTTYDSDRIHHFVLTRFKVDSTLSRYAASTDAERRDDPLMPAQRSDVLVAGMLILQSVMRLLDINELMVSETDILDGLLTDP